MSLWLITGGSILGALILQYVCASRILRMKQSTSIKNVALRDIRNECARLADQESELRNQQNSLVQSIKRLRTDIMAMLQHSAETGLEVPQPEFPLDDPIEDRISNASEDTDTNASHLVSESAANDSTGQATDSVDSS